MARIKFHVAMILIAYLAIFAPMVSTWSAQFYDSEDCVASPNYAFTSVVGNQDYPTGALTVGEKGIQDSCIYYYEAGAKTWPCVGPMWPRTRSLQISANTVCTVAHGKPQEWGEDAITYSIGSANKCLKLPETIVNSQYVTTFECWNARLAVAVDASKLDARILNITGGPPPYPYVQGDAPELQGGVGRNKVKGWAVVVATMLAVGPRVDIIVLSTFMAFMARVADAGPVYAHISDYAHIIPTSSDAAKPQPQSFFVDGEGSFELFL